MRAFRIFKSLQKNLDIKVDTESNVVYNKNYSQKVNGRKGETILMNKVLNRAKKNKNDEFYTRMQDIEEELQHYTEQLKGKIVYCNSDNPKHSEFWNYFYSNFNNLGLKGLIATYKINDDSEFYATKTEYYGSVETITTKLEGDGDFRSDECIEIAKQSDIICTNPPFSLFREYIQQLSDIDKQFLVIGNMNAIVYKDIFPLIRDDKMWLGMSNFNKGMYFKVPQDFAYSNSYKFKKEIDGVKVSRVPSVCWFTNLDHIKRHQTIPLLTMSQNLELSKNGIEYIYYDNYNAIEIPLVEAIPSDYSGVMGVPVTFLDKYSPKQFKIVGSNRGVNQDTEGIYGKSSYLNGKETFKRLFIQLKNKSNS